MVVTTDDVRLTLRLSTSGLYSEGAADVEGLMSPPARSCSCHTTLLMLLTQTASSTPNFILNGAGFVWQTLPALGRYILFESHYHACCCGLRAAVLYACEEVIPAHPATVPIMLMQSSLKAYQLHSSTTMHSS